ncbi:MAG: [FeFe] hydrogenase, group A [Clostridiales bacterium]|jgi:NADP-reducing hydrogenase subunit HndD|nr:[FeFe] hydrogenase, group A [Clostridiales bacterium]
MDKLINLKINGIAVSVPQGTTILEAARSAGIKIPTLCYLKDINAIGACRVCVVEVKGARSLVASCVYPVNEGMEVTTSSPKVLASRKTTVELMLSDHNKNCLSCVRSTNCELQSLATELGCDALKYKGETKYYPIDDSHPSIVRDNSKCILCRRCVAACKNYQSISVIGANARGFDTHIGCLFEKGMNEIACVGCGQCIIACPTGALREKDEIDNVLAALSDPTKTVVVGTAPSIRVALGEEFGQPIGTNVEGKMAAALRRIGFKHVFDVNFTADLTIMEEGYEFIERVKGGGVLPMITSCSPGWVKFIEHNFPELLPNLSSCKSPQQMFGAVAKTYYAKKLGIDPKDMYVVTIMPCTAKKFEKGRAHQAAAGVPDIDAVLTTRELARLIKRQGIIFNELPDEAFDAPFGIGSGAGLIFGSSGGVMEAALRTVAEALEGKELTKLDFTAVRGMTGIKEAAYKVAGLTVKVAVASGLKNARALMEKIKKGEASYHFIEIMACPGGCINGGGQPIKTAEVRNFVDYKGARMKAIYKGDKTMTLRKSHENPAIKEIYAEFFGAPNSHKAHEILHTQYVARNKF